jgi:hypothetical protein
MGNSNQTSQIEKRWKETQANRSLIEKIADSVKGQLLLISIRKYVVEGNQDLNRQKLKKHNFSELSPVRYTDIYNFFPFDLVDFLLETDDIETLRYLHEHLPSTTSGVSKYYRIDKPIEFTSKWHHRCSTCGEPFRVLFTGEDFIVLNECKFPNGPIAQMDIPFPSGKIIVENDNRSLFPKAEKDRNIWYLMDTALVGKDYAEEGCAHFYVGNCCPGVYQLGKDKLAVGNPKERRKTLTIENRRYRNVATVCTDLWWYSMTDFDEWTKRVGAEPKSSASLDIVTVQPGLYRFTHLRHTYQGVVGYGDHDAQSLYTKIERIGEVGEVKPEYKIIPA